jgi:magnesium transporter
MISHILEMIAARQFQAARTALNDLNTIDLAEAFEELDQHDLVKLFRMLAKDSAADVFAYSSRDLQKRIIDAITDRELGEIMKDLFLDDAVDLIEEMPANVVKRLLQNADRETRALINTFLQYPQDSAGSIMTIEFVDLRADMTVREAFDHIRQTGPDKETLYTCYAIDQQRRLRGVVSVRTLLLSDPDEKIEQIMDTQFVSVQTRDDQEQIAYLFDHYDLLSIPVVDAEKRLVGIITVDDALDVIREENTEDFEKMAAVLPLDESYLQTKAVIHAGRRIPWLLFLMVSAIFTGIIITHFEDALAVMPALVAFIPMLMDTGGNCGSQSATLVIRGLALGQIALTDGLRVLYKEFRVSLLVGAILSLINIVRVFLINGNLALAVTVGLSLYATVIIAKLIGSMLPILASSLKLDPAIMASPVITTIVDASSLFLFFSIARLILQI